MRLGPMPDYRKWAGDSPCLNIVSIRAIGCSFMPKQWFKLYKIEKKLWKKKKNIYIYIYVYRLIMFIIIITIEIIIIMNKSKNNNNTTNNKIKKK